MVPAPDEQPKRTDGPRRGNQKAQDSTGKEILVPGLDEALEQAMSEFDFGDGEQPEASSEDDGGQADSADNDSDEGGEEKPPESDDEDGDEPDSESEDEEGDEEEPSDEDEGGGEQPESVELDTESSYQLSDGTEVTGQELADGYLRQSDYTRKTQAVAQQRKKLEQREQQITDWLQEVRENPADAVLEVASASQQPMGTIAGALASDGNATGNAALLLRTLADQGQLSQEFIDHFGIETSGPVSQQADQAAKDDRIESLEKREQEREQERQRQQIVDQYHQQWETIKGEADLDFANEDESQAKIELMRYARDRQIPDLHDAYYAMKARGEGFAGRQAEAKEKRTQEARQTASKKVEQKKKRAKAQNRRGSGQGQPQAKAGANDLTGAIEQAMQEHGV